MASTGLATPAYAAPGDPPVEPRAWPTGNRIPAASELDLPWDVVQLADGSLLITVSKTGQVIHSAPGSQRVVGTIADVDPTGEGGLLGLAADPLDRRLFFAYRTTARGNEVVRFTFDGTRLSDQRTVLTGIPHGVRHFGGRLAFGPDGFLYVSTGDAGVPSQAQDTGNLAGKILRINRDGTAAAGNPFGNLVWSFGHRNVQGLAWDSQDRLWASEFGNNRWDELNLIEPGRNYGWPVIEGVGADPRFANPVHVWTPAEMSPSGIAIIDDEIHIAALRGQSIWTVSAKGGTPRRWLQGELGRVRTVVPARDGRVLAVTSNGRGADVVQFLDRSVLRSPIGRAYASLGGAGGRLGEPVTGEYCGLRNDGCFQLYQRGSIYWTEQTGANPVWGAIGDRWVAMGWELGRLGYPLGAEECGRFDGGCLQKFEGGVMMWSARSGAHPVWGAIGTTYAEFGAETSQLRYPTGPEFCTIRDGGCFQRFQNGHIYYSPAGGTQPVWGAIFDGWAAQRWEDGPLGYPTSREFCGLRDSGCFQRFENGSMYWSPASGAHPVRGAIRSVWGDSGWEYGRYRYPISTESCRPGRCSQRFQGGEIVVTW